MNNGRAKNVTMNNIFNIILKLLFTLVLKKLYDNINYTQVKTFCSAGIEICINMKYNKSVK